MQSEVRKVLESMRGNGWNYWFWNEIDAAERADAAKRGEPVRDDKFSFVVECKRCGQSTCTSEEYAAVCGCGAVFKLHRHDQPSSEGIRKSVLDGSTFPGPDEYMITYQCPVCKKTGRCANKTMPGDCSCGHRFGTLPKPTLSADEHIRTIAAQAVRDAMPDVLNGLADTFGEVGFTSVTSAFREHADKLRKKTKAKVLELCKELGVENDKHKID